MLNIFQIRLKELRENAGYTQHSFADAFGVAQSTVGNWEAGKREPNFETAQRIADFFNVTTDYLLGRTDDQTPLPEKNRSIDDETLKIGLWGDTEITDEVLDEVKRFAQFARAQRKTKEE